MQQNFLPDSVWNVVGCSMLTVSERGWSDRTLATTISTSSNKSDSRSIMVFMVLWLYSSTAVCRVNVLINVSDGGVCSRDLASVVVDLLCLFKCVFKWWLFVKAFPQSGFSHLNGLSFEWTLRCFLRSLLVVNTFEHPGSGQLNVFPINDFNNQ